MTSSKLILSGVFLCFLQHGFCQDVPDQSPQMGFLPSNTYTIDNLESTDRVNGNVIYQIPLAKLPRVGASEGFQLNLTYNSQNLLASYGFVSDPRLGPGQYLEKANLIGASGWNYNLQYVFGGQTRPIPPGGSPNCPDQTSYKLYSYYFQTPDGNRHPLDLYGYGDANGDGFYAVDAERFVQLSCSGSSPVSGPLTFFTNDGSYIRLVITAGNGTAYPAWTAYYPDGTQVASPGGITAYKITISDKNKNVTTIAGNQNGLGFTISNAAGSISVTQNQATSAQTDTISQYGFAAAPLTWTVNYQLVGFSGGTGYYICDSLGDQCPASLSAYLISSINLPSPSGVPLTFNFGYSTNGGWGNLNNVQYPSGATVKYQFQNDGSSIGVGPFFLTNPVVRKEVDYNDVQDGITTPRSEVWTFAYEVNRSYCNSMTGPDQGVDTICFTQLRPTSEALTGTIYKDTTPTGQMDEKEFAFNRPAWDDTRAPNPYLVMEVKTAAGTSPQAAVTAYATDANGNQTQTSEYDFVPYSNITHGPTGQPSGSPSGTLLRNTSKLFTVQAPAASNNQSTPDSSAGYWNPSVANFLRLVPRSVTTGGGPGAAEEFSYDANADVHETRRWDSTKSASLPASLNASNSVVDDYNYSGVGNVTSHTDGRGIQTTYNYDPSGIYLQCEILAAQTAQTETIGFTEDPYTSLLTSRTDANGVVTSYGYDPLGRLTLTREAAGQAIERDTKTTYEDGNLRIVTCSDQNQTGDGALIQVSDYDPLGRMRLSRQMETAACASPDDDTTGIKTQTRYLYSGTGSYKLVSNPFREANSSAASSACNNNFPQCMMGWTLKSYDQDGRVYSQQTFDGSGLPPPWGANKNVTGTIQTSYNAQATTLTDQVGNVKIDSADGVGRLHQVQEDPSGLAYLTVYTYDALNNLTNVNQNGRTRTFVYDSVSRLKTATNPETGSIGYTYDADGNLMPRPMRAARMRRTITTP